RWRRGRGSPFERVSGRGLPSPAGGPRRVTGAVRAHAQVLDPAARVGRPSRHHAPRRRRAGAGTVDSGERRPIVLGERPRSVHSRQGVLSQRSFLVRRGVVDEAVRLGGAGARALGGGGGGGGGAGMGAEPPTQG